MHSYISNFLFLLLDSIEIPHLKYDRGFITIVIDIGTMEDVIVRLEDQPFHRGRRSSKDVTQSAADNIGQVSRLTVDNKVDE